MLEKLINIIGAWTLSDAWPCGLLAMPGRWTGHLGVGLTGPGVLMGAWVPVWGLGTGTRSYDADFGCLGTGLGAWASSSGD
ncbi:hypothetical protein PIB30_043382 [Stylosanthes scabra]|uniref:Uncharacterized protein n=1 Tax=Stylosanthes scabra TaxID=79078 RepID=A0ABU6ZE95_9FABA|nr:hypothetical protein [Stylosanthes scabra]